METPGTVAREYLREHRAQAAIELDVAASLLAERILHARQSPLDSARWDMPSLEREFSALTRARQVLRLVNEARHITIKRRHLPFRGGIEFPPYAAAEMSAAWRLELLALGRRISGLTALVAV